MKKDTSAKPVRVMHRERAELALYTSSLVASYILCACVIGVILTEGLGGAFVPGELPLELKLTAWFVTIVIAMAFVVIEEKTRVVMVSFALLIDLIALISLHLF